MRREGHPDAGAQESLSPTGDNLANVIQYLRERHPQRLEEILRILRRRVPRIEKVQAEVLADGRLLPRIKDAPFRTPVPVPVRFGRNPEDAGLPDSAARSPPHPD